MWRRWVNGWSRRQADASMPVVCGVWAAGLAMLCLMAASGGTALAATRTAAPRSCGTDTPAPPASASGASITLSRTKGPPGMSLSVSGTGWPAGMPVVLNIDAQQGDGTLYILAQVDATVTVAADGTFQTAAFAVPQAGGCGAAVHASDVLFVAHVGDYSVGAEAPFTYTSQPTLISTSGGQVRQGFAVSLTGANWEPGEQVTITSGILSTPQLACAPQVPPACQQPTKPVPSATAHTTANAQGAISLTYSLPDGLAPRTGVLVQATGTGPLYGTVAAPPMEFLIRPAVDPTLAVDRATGTAGVALHVKGDHWYPGDTVVIEYCRGEGITVGETLSGLGGPAGLRCTPETTQWLGQVTVDKSGGFSATVSLPTNARTGQITIQARVPNDVFGLQVYAQSAPFEIVTPPPPPLPWSRQHPRLSLALTIARPAVPAAGLGVLLLAAYVWKRRRTRRLVAAGQAVARHS